jgi:hypothetical protein
MPQGGAKGPRFTNITPHFRNASLKPAIQPDKPRYSTLQPLPLHDAGKI